MHGVSRSAKYATVDEAKKAANAAKVEKYKALSAIALKKRAERSYDEEALALTGTLLKLNPEFYTLWNYRKETLEWLASDSGGAVGPEKMLALIQAELALTEEAIKKHPKSYWAWYQRQWVHRLHPDQPDWRREVALCNLLLKLDSRNFHCWTYRRFVVAQAGIPDSEEFDWTTELIHLNFSNYSAWHQRSVLHGRAAANANSPDALQAALDADFDLVRNAFYTEPDDQSSWLYHRWLVSQKPAEDSSFLSAELAKINEVVELEPDAKWPRLTCVFLLGKLLQAPDLAADRRQQYHSDFKAHLARLQDIDPRHAQFYIDHQALQQEQ